MASKGYYSKRGTSGGPRPRIPSQDSTSSDLFDQMVDTSVNSDLQAPSLPLLKKKRDDSCVRNSTKVKSFAKAALTYNYSLHAKKTTRIDAKSISDSNSNMALPSSDRPSSPIDRREVAVVNGGSPLDGYLKKGRGVSTVTAVVNQKSEKSLRVFDFDDDQEEERPMRPSKNSEKLQVFDFNKGGSTSTTTSGRKKLKLFDFANDDPDEIFESSSSSATKSRTTSEPVVARKTVVTVSSLVGGGGGGGDKAVAMETTGVARSNSTSKPASNKITRKAPSLSSSSSSSKKISSKVSVAKRAKVSKGKEEASGPSSSKKNGRKRERGEDERTRSVVKSGEQKMEGERHQRCTVERGGGATQEESSIDGGTVRENVEEKSCFIGREEGKVTGALEDMAALNHGDLITGRGKTVTTTLEERCSIRRKCATTAVDESSSNIVRGKAATRKDLEAPAQHQSKASTNSPQRIKADYSNRKRKRPEQEGLVNGGGNDSINLSPFKHPLMITSPAKKQSRSDADVLDEIDELLSEGTLGGSSGADVGVGVGGGRSPVKVSSSVIILQQC